MASTRNYGAGKEARIAFRVTPELKHELELKCITLGIKFSEAMTEALTDWIAKQKWLEQKGKTSEHS